MEVIHPRCAGLDVHKKSVVACRVRTRPNGHKEQEIVTFGTTTPELLRLLDWLREGGCTHAAMESTGDYWKPVYYLLEGHVALLLVNARHIKAVPGRKTDVKDAEWIADLLRHGLLRASFVPPREQRDLRDLTRQRTKLVEEHARVLNRVQKVLESANIKLASVATDIGGVSARAMLKALIAGDTDPNALAELARGRMRGKLGELPAALTGSVREHHRFLLAEQMAHLEFLEKQIAHFDARIAAQIAAMTQPPVPPSAPSEDPAGGPVPVSPAGEPPGLGEPPPPAPYPAAIALLDPIPGIDVGGAETILAELGTDMRVFPSAAHAASWTGIAPGNYESAGKRYSGKTPPGNRALRKALVQAARGAIRTKESSFGALYRRVCARRGDKRATVAVAHALLVVIYQILLWQKPYEELGAAYVDLQDRTRNAQRLVKRLNRLGYDVVVTPRPAATAA
jgi:transposase